MTNLASSAYASRYRVIGYWVTTALVVFELALGGVWDILRVPQVRDLIERLGYPQYFLVILGIWKLLGAVALVIPRFPRLKEWAYAGVVFDLTGAVASLLASGVVDAGAQPVSGTTAFAIACATGAAALSVIYGATQPLAILLVALSAAAGGLLRRWSGAAGAGPLVQAFLAALVAGAVGAAATHLHLGASIAVVAICPAMVLVPGPHILNGALDLLDLRVTLGLARLAYGLLVLTAISGGLILGLRIGGQTLAVTAPPSSAPLIIDVIAAGVGAASYAVYFSMPWRMVVWPVAAGMLAHAAHWYALDVGASLAVAAFVSCLLVGVLLVPVSHRMRIPFAGIGFASVVALVPGVFVFRTLAGFVEFAGHPSPQLFSSTAADLIVGTVIVTGMALGLALPMHVYASRLARRWM